MFVRATSEERSVRVSMQRLQHRGLFTAVVDTPEALSEVDDDDDDDDTKK